MLSSRYSIKRLTLLCVIISICISCHALHADQPSHLSLTILYTNDVHGHLFPFDYSRLGTTETDVGGAARRATLIRKIKSEIANPVIVMDAGDVFARGPLQDLEGEPDIAIMNAVPYDIMTLGNHEFDGDAYTNDPGPRGLEILRKRIKQAEFPVISANVIDNSTGKTLAAPYHIFELGGIKIGVFGLTTPRASKYPQTANLQFLDPVTTAKKAVSELANKCNFVVALSHLGILPDLELADCVSGIDVIIGGDSHTWVFEPMLVKNASRTIICQDGEWGKEVGELDLCIDRTENGHYTVATYSGKLIDVNSSIPPAKDVESIIQRYAKPYMVKIGTLDSEVTPANAPAWIAEGLRETTKADMGFQAKEGVESGLKAGPITELDLRKMIPWNNKVVIVKATCAQLSKLMLEQNAGFAGAELHDGQLYVGNTKADLAKTYTLASTDYYARTSSAIKDAQSAPTDFTVREILSKYLKSSQK